MKKLIIRFSSLCLMLTLIQSAPLKAQFFKELLNTVKQTAQSRADSKTSHTTNKALDKLDSATQVKSNHTNHTVSNNSVGDTAATHSVLGAFAKAAAENPNDTSSADVTMKALGIMAGGGGISSQDSITTINSYKTSSGGSGVEYDYSITTSGKKLATIKDTSRYFFTNSGEGRMEMRIPMPGVRMNKMISIGRYSEPKYSMILYPESKTYSLNIINASMVKGNETYQVTKIGTETVQGYSCIHSRIISTIGSGMFKSTTTMDIWTSNSVPGHSLYEKLTSLQTVEIGMMNALQQAGCAGVFVKMLVTGNDSSVEELLIKTQENNFPAEIFRIPNGYGESKDNVMAHMVRSSNK